MYNPDHDFRTLGEKNRIHSSTLRNVESSVTKRFHSTTDIEIKNQLAIELQRQKDLNQPILTARLERTVAIHKALMKTPNHRRHYKDFKAIEKKIDTHSNKLQQIDNMSDLLSKSDLLSLASQNCIKNFNNVVKFSDAIDHKDDKCNILDTMKNNKINNTDCMETSPILHTNLLTVIEEREEVNNNMTSTNSIQSERLENEGHDEDINDFTVISNAEVEHNMKLNEIEIENYIVEKEMAALFRDFGGLDNDSKIDITPTIVNSKDVTSNNMSSLETTKLDSPTSLLESRLRRKEYTRIKKWYFFIKLIFLYYYFNSNIYDIFYHNLSN